VQHASIYADSPGGATGHWDVEVVNGNYYNVHTLAQVNYLSDGDIVQQTISDTHYDVVAGGNQLMNLAQLQNGEINNDLIIVGGSYHGASAIYQYNILVNHNFLNSVIQNVSPGESEIGHQTIATGGNTLENAATIETYGNDKFVPLSAGHQQILDGVASGATVMDEYLFSLAPGYGGTLHVLYITGDYYDVNAIWQTNIISDVNYVSQTFDPTGQVAAIGPVGGGVQSVSAGHDAALNLSSIVVAGIDHAAVGGQIYTDSVMIQANLLSAHPAAVASPDPQSFAPELVAFLNDGTVHDTPAPMPSPVVHTTIDDMISTVMH
jgi:hypothetical protein